MPDRAVISVHSRSDTSERLGRLAQATNRSRSWLANEAIERYLAEEEAFLAAVERGAAQADAGEVTGSAEAKVVLRRRLEARIGDGRT